MRLSLLLVLAVSLGAAAPVRAQSDDPPLSGTKVAGEIALGAVAGPVGFVGGGLATRWVARRVGAGEEGASRAAYWGAWTGMALATAAPPTLIGTRGVTTGSYAAAVGGAAAGTLGSWALVRLNLWAGAGTEPCRVRCVVSTAAVVLLPSIGATVGFNLSRKYEAGRAPGDAAALR